MTGSFRFNGIDSSTFGLICKSVKRPLLPSIKKSSSDSKGTSGIHDRDEYEYDSRQITMKIQFAEGSFEELRIKVRAIAAWLSSPKRCKLIIDDEPDKYYLGKVVDDTDFNFVAERLIAGTADITFVCQPFAYSTVESSFVFDSSDLPSCTFTNEGTRVINYKSPPGSKSLIKVVGSWTSLSLTMNNKTITYTSPVVNRELTLNNASLEADLGGLNCINSLTGEIDDFLPIVNGENTLVLSGLGLDISSVTIEFIELWI